MAIKISMNPKIFALTKYPRMGNIFFTLVNEPFKVFSNCCQPMKYEVKLPRISIRTIILARS
jgi:hypothetical protein